MATEAQIAANRSNAQKSTGPKTDEGKAVSRLNATDHGLTATLPEAVGGRDAIEARKQLWRPELKPSGETQEHLFEQVVVESLRVERCQEAFFSLCRRHADRARTLWDDDRRREAEDLATGLAKAPRLVAARLEATPQGCAIKLELWTGLRSSLLRHHDWTDRQRSLALDLLGIHPDLRDAETPIDPTSNDIFITRATLADAEIARLSDLRDHVLSGLDASERALAETSLGAEFTRPVQLLDRYERAATRRQTWAWRKLEAAQRDPAPVPAATKPTQSEPQARPAPKPVQPIPIAVEPRQTEIEDVVPRPAYRPATPNRHERRKLAALERRAG
jgi:hypothetical protein